MKKLSLAIIAASLGNLVSFTASANILFSGSYSQDFDTLASSGTSVTWVNDSTLSGWYLFTGAGAAISTYRAGTGSDNAGSFYSFGTAGNTERALGGLASGGAYFGSPTSGAVAGYIAVALENNSGSTYSSVNISFNGEQWRNGGTTAPAAQTMQLQYGFGVTYAGVSTWVTPGGTFNWTSPDLTPNVSGAAVDGNVGGLVSGVGGTLTGLTWNNADTLWIRWVENNDVGNDHGLAIDNLSVSVPEPTTAALLGLGLTALIIRRRK